ncbi:unnamed protein product, partial [Prorocentrum cordatum]
MASSSGDFMMMEVDDDGADAPAIPEPAKGIERPGSTIDKNDGLRDASPPPPPRPSGGHSGRQKADPKPMAEPKKRFCDFAGCDSEAMRNEKFCRSHVTDIKAAGEDAARQGPKAKAEFSLIRKGGGARLQAYLSSYLATCQ